MRAFKNAVTFLAQTFLFVPFRKHLYCFGITLNHLSLCPTISYTYLIGGKLMT